MRDKTTIYSGAFGINLTKFDGIKPIGSLFALF